MLTSIKGKLLFVQLAMVFVTISVLSFIYIEQIKGHTLKAVSSGLTEKAFLVGKDIEHILAGKLSDLESLSQSLIFELADNRSLGSQFTQQLLTQIKNRDPSIHNIYTVVREGDEFRLDIQAVQLGDFSQLESFLSSKLFAIIANKLVSGSQPYISYSKDSRGDLLLSLVSPILPSSKEHDLSHDHGFLIVEYNFSDIKVVLSELSSRVIGNKYTYLLNSNGKVVATDDPGYKTLRKLDELLNSPELVHRLSEREANGAVNYTDSFNTEVLGAYSILFPRGELEALKWTLLISAPKALMLNPLYELNKDLIFITMVIIFVVVIAIFLVTKNITNPISQLVAFAKMLRGGSYNKKITCHDSEEFALLAAVLSESAEKIYHDKKTMQDNILKAEMADKAKSRFLTTISHEIRTPMNGVLGIGQILLKTPLNDAQHKHVQTILESGNHMMQLLNDILDFSKIEQGKLELDKTDFNILDIIDSLEGTYHSIAAEKGIEFKVISTIAQGFWLNADKARIRQILFNLINNAIKFTEKGSVVVKFEAVAFSHKQYQLTISVEDSGIGIDPSRIGAIFEPFTQEESSTTRNFGGTGLGLSIVRQIANLMEGDVSLESAKGIGSIFTVVLLLDEGTEKSVVPDPMSIEKFHGLHVLIVEDNRINRLVLESFLASRMITFRSLTNGAEALCALADADYDLILMDNHMPVMDGIEATTAIRNLPTPKAKIPIFACTADVFQEAKNKMLQAGADDVLLKPLKEETLIAALNRLDDGVFTCRPDVPVPQTENGLLPTLPLSEQPAWKKPISTLDGYINLTTLLSNSGQDYQIVESLLDLLVVDAGKADIEFKTAYTKRDFTNMASIVHLTKGFAGNLGAEPLQQLSADLQALVERKVLPTELQVQDHSDTIAATIMRAKTILSELRDTGKLAVI